MAVSLEVLAGCLAGVLLVVTTLALLFGAIGGVFGERFGTCPRCGRQALTAGRRFHPDGCPPSVHSRVVHALDISAHPVHLRHN